MSSGSISLTNIQRALIGKGAGFPFSFSEDFGGVEGVADVDGLSKIRSNIYVVLSTRMGESINNPAFGSRFPDLLFEPVLISERLAFEAREALAKYVPQIEIITIVVAKSPDVDTVVLVSGTFRVRNTPVRDSFVFPFNTGKSPLS